MDAPILNKRIEMALRIAINHGGTLGYNPDMYRLGFDDNNIPSSEFNEELKKYGTLKRKLSMYMDEYDYYQMNTWNSFTINDYGREVIKAIDRERNGVLGVKKIFRFLWLALQTIIGNIIGIVMFCIIAYFVASISPTEEYSWYMGIWHAIFIVPNFLIHFCYDPSLLYYAEKHTLAYSIFFWIIFVTSILPGVIQYLKCLIVDLLKQWINPFSDDKKITWYEFNLVCFTSSCCPFWG